MTPNVIKQRNFNIQERLLEGLHTKHYKKKDSPSPYLDDFSFSLTPSKHTTKAKGGRLST